MQARTRTLRWLLVLFIAVVLFAAVLLGAVPVAVILAPLLIFFQLAIVICVPRFDRYEVVPTAPALPLLAPRPPPIS